MIELVNAEDAQGRSIMELAADIQKVCRKIDYAECPMECDCYDDLYGCKLKGDDPTDWEL